jgi:predicted nucleotidyltransferase
MDIQHEKLIKDLCTELSECNTVIGIILFGSIADGSNHKKSDIDLYIIGENEHDRVTTHFRNEIFIQIQWRSFIDFQSKIVKRTRIKPISLTGKILYDPTSQITRYIEKGKVIAKQGPFPLSNDEINKSRLYITEELGCIDHLIEVKKNVQAHLSIDDTLFELLSLYYNYNNWWWPIKKNMINDLIALDQDIGMIGEQIILSSDIMEKNSLLKDLSGQILPLVGGELRELEIYF